MSDEIRYTDSVKNLLEQYDTIDGLEETVSQLQTYLEVQEGLGLRPQADVLLNERLTLEPSNSTQTLRATFFRIPSEDAEDAFDLDVDVTPVQNARVDAASRNLAASGASRLEKSNAWFSQIALLFNSQESIQTLYRPLQMANLVPNKTVIRGNQNRIAELMLRQWLEAFATAEPSNQNPFVAEAARSA